MEKLAVADTKSSFTEGFIYERITSNIKQF